MREKSGDFFDEAMAIRKIEELKPVFSVEYYSYCYRYTPSSTVMDKPSNREKRSFGYPSFRFLGGIPTGKFKYKCVCGEYSGSDNKLNRGSQCITCKHCGRRFVFRQQKNHFHLEVCVSEEEQFQQECAEGLHK